MGKSMRSVSHFVCFVAFSLAFACALPQKTAYCYHREDASQHKCYEGCASADFKATGLTHPGECNPAVFTVTESAKTVDQCSDGKTNLKYCTGGSLHAVNITMKVKGEAFSIFAATSLKQCTSDADCPCSYCMNDASKKPPFFCHAPKEGLCCTKDSDCPGSYCVNYHGPPPYHCHGSLATEVVETAPATCGSSKNVVATVVVRSHAIAAAKVDWCVSNSSSAHDGDKCTVCVDSLPAQPGNLTIAITDDVDYFVFAFKGKEGGEQELYPDFVSGDWPETYDLQDPSA